MVWTVLGTVLGTILVVLLTAIPLVALDAIGPATGVVGWLFARGIWQFAGAMESKGSDDPVYKKNLQRLIERNRQFEEARKGKE